MEDGKTGEGAGGAELIEFGSVLALWSGWWAGGRHVMAFVGKQRGFSDML